MNKHYKTKTLKLNVNQLTLHARNIYETHCIINRVVSGDIKVLIGYKTNSRFGGI